jgi:hypothetical protein
MMKGSDLRSSSARTLWQQLVAGHRLHVPVADHQAVLVQLQLLQRFLPVGGLVQVVETQLLSRFWMIRTMVL